MWDLIVSVPDHCLSFYCNMSMTGLDAYYLLIKRTTNESALFSPSMVVTRLASDRVANKKYRSVIPSKGLL